jgi:hypothetical protein
MGMGYWALGISYFSVVLFCPLIFQVSHSRQVLAQPRMKISFSASLPHRVLLSIFKLATHGKIYCLLPIAYCLLEN